MTTKTLKTERKPVEGSSAKENSGVNMLVKEVRKRAQEEKQALMAEYKKNLEEEKRKIKEDIADYKIRLEEELRNVHEKLLADYRKKREFELRMDLLEEKENLLQSATEELLEEILALPFEKRKELYVKALERNKHLFREEFTLFVPRNRMREAGEIFSAIGLSPRTEEEGTERKEGFLIRGKDFIFVLSLEELIKNTVEERKDYFVKTLFL